MLRNRVVILCAALIMLSAILVANNVGPAAAQEPTEEVKTTEHPQPQGVNANVGSGFTYQGYLEDGNQPADGTYDFQFMLYDVDTGGTPLDSTSAGDIAVVDGRFTTPLTFGAGTFDGTELWLEVRVRPGDSSGSHTALSPRQLVQPAPYANTLRPGASIAASYGSTLLTVDNDDNRGMYVEAGDDGIQVTAGSPDFFGYALGAGTGVEVNAENTGVFVGRANQYGVWVNHTGNHGVRVSNAGGDGVRVEHADGYGVRVESEDTAVYAESPNTTSNSIEAWNPNDREWRVASSGQVYADGSFNSGGADFAEMLPAVDGLEPGDVLVIGADGRLARSTTVYETSVIGVYSGQPGFVGGNGDDDDPSGKAPVGIVGVVQVKVSGENGAIVPGDLLTSSSVAGHAMKAGDDPPQGTVLGKAMQPFDGDAGVITMLVMLQ